MADEIHEKPIRKVVRDAIISAFSIAAALIWKEFIIEFIEQVIPEQSQLVFKFMTAVAATIVVMIIIFFFLKTEKKAYRIIKEVKENSVDK